jgi:hypothetical protein
MEYKPNVGLVDFFAVLLPGALLAFLLKGKIPPNINFPSTEGWVAFVFAAYLLGQFTYLVGATFMDRIYDLTYLRYMTRGGDALWEKAKKRVGDKAKMASELKWIRAYVRLSSPDAAIEIERFEATSKFFRSLFIVLLVYAGYFVYPWQWHAFAATLGLLVLSFWRFCDQRWKFTELSCLYFYQLTANGETSTRG